MDNQTPLVSIVTPAYNSEKFILETISSIQNQTYQNWELLITDDASSDNTVNIIKKIASKDKRIKCFVNTTNEGAAVSRNNGLEMAQGRFIAFLDSDDLWYPEKLEKQLAFMIKNKTPICFTSYDLINEESKALNKVIKTVPSIDYKGHFKNTVIGMSTAIIDTNIVTKKFRFVNIRTRQDCYLWITLLKRGHLAYGMKDVLGSYRVRKGSISSNKIKAAQKVWYLYYNLEKLGFFKSLYYFSFYVSNAIKKRIVD
ncbi:MAG: glycosyltransferase family 2 protein [Flavobacteriaceae bacterium]